MVRARVELPPGSPRGSGLLAVARSLEDVETEWWRGVVFSSTGCVGPQLMGPCEEEFITVGPQMPDAVGDVRTFVPVQTRQGIACSALSGTNIAALTGQRLDLTREWALGHTLQTGEHTTHEVGTPPTEVDNPALVDATLLNGGATIPLSDALPCLEQHAADEFFGGPANFHASPLLLNHLIKNGGLVRDGRRWVTATGNVVISSPGYTGTNLYVTSEVFATAGQRAVLDGIDRTVNEVSAWAEDLVMAVFDPCWSGQVQVDVPDCTTAT